MDVSRIVIEPLTPCKDRLDNYIKHYGNREFSKRQFMGLKNITHADKVWVAFRLMDRKQVSLAAADIAESVLYIYESQYPNDKRPREAIEAIRAYVRGEITLEQLCERRNAADSAYAYAAANAAAHAAYAAANAAYAAFAFAFATKAAYAAAHAADAAAYVAAYAADSAAITTAIKSGRAAQEKLCRTIALRYWK